MNRCTIPEIETTRITLATGVTLKLAFGGPEDAEAIIFLHGFPESHRSWRHQLNALGGSFRVVAPDQRGFAGSDKPEAIQDYETDKMVADLWALADALGIDRFTLVGHDWGGVVAWLAALRRPERLKRLVIVNAPHPLIFQKSLVDDEGQREASQYIRLFKTPGVEKAIKLDLDSFFDKVFDANADLRKIPPAERQHYLDDWAQPGALTAMLNWYRASGMKGPEPGEKAMKPLWTHLPFPTIKLPTLVIWGMKDTALLPVQLDGLHDVVENLRIVTATDAGHFVQWERPEIVNGAIRDFIAETL